MTINLQHISARYAKAVEVAELRWAILRNERDRFHPIHLARYIRSLRMCHRFREDLRTAMEKGNL